MSTEPRPPNQKPRHRATRGARVAWTAFFVLACAVFVGVAALAYTGHLLAFEAFMSKAQPVQHTVQLGLIAILWLRWEQFVHWLAERGHIQSRSVQPLLRARHRLMAALLAAQLLLVMGLPWSLLGGPGGR